MLLCAAFLLVQAASGGQSPAPTAESRPAWISVLPDAPGRLYAVGTADLGASETEARTRASDRARIEVVSRLRATVKGETAVLTQTHEAAQALPWQVADAPADFVASLLKVIVGIEIPVQRWIGKWKVSQNRPATDQQGVAAGLQGQGNEEAAQMAALVQQRIQP